MSRATYLGSDPDVPSPPAEIGKMLTCGRCQIEMESGEVFNGFVDQVTVDDSGFEGFPEMMASIRVIESGGEMDSSGGLGVSVSKIKDPSRREENVKVTVRMDELKLSHAFVLSDLSDMPSDHLLDFLASTLLRDIEAKIKEKLEKAYFP